MPVLVILSAIVLQAGGTLAEPEGSGRGRRWVRSHPFYLSGLTQTPERYDVSVYRAAGLNTLLAWKPGEGLFAKSAAVGLPWHYHIYHTRYGETPDEVVAHAREIVEKYPGCTGLMFGDEPSQAAMEKFGETCEALRRAFPDKLIYSNAFPIGATMDRYFGGEPPEGYGYEDYFDAFARLVRGDVLMFDIYPFGAGDGHSGAYFPNLEIVRRTGLKYGVPYWVFVQAYERESTRRLPSESDLRMQLFSSLAYGFTGISYFTYDVAFERGLVELNAEPSPLYEPAARANREVANLGRALRFLTSTGVGYVSGRQENDGQAVENPLPSGTTHWREVKARPPEIRDVGAEGRDALIGFFEDDDGRRYFMLVNLSHGAGKSAAECAQTVRITFAPEVQAVTRLSRETGRPEELAVRDRTLALKLPGGTGELLRVGMGGFPGVE
jgi:hypothetical protein